MDEVLREDILVSYEIQLNSGTLFSNSNEKSKNETGTEPKLPFWPLTPHKEKNIKK